MLLPFLLILSLIAKFIEIDISVPSFPMLPKGWNDWILWQYTDGQTGPEPHSVKGIGPCDRDKFNGTLEELKNFWLTGE